MSNHIYSEVKPYFVGNDEYALRIFAFPADNEIDFEIYNKDGDYMTTITSNRPDLATSVVWRYLKGIPTDAITYVAEGSL